MQRENELILQYLRNITSKVSTLFEKMEFLEKTVLQLGQACGMAFNQTKEVVNKLAVGMEETREDLAEYGGIIEADSFFNGC
jgi:hypothetical protein